MGKLLKALAIVLIVAGGIQVVAGAVTYYMVHSQLADEKIVVSGDADFLAGDEVDGPFSAYSEAETIKKHADEIAGGLTYAELDQDDERRPQVMTASFLRASLFTSVVAFGVGALVIALGILFVIIGVALLDVNRNLGTLATAAGRGDPGDTASTAVAIVDAGSSDHGGGDADLA